MEWPTWFQELPTLARFGLCFGVGYGISLAMQYATIWAIVLYRMSRGK